MLAPQVLPTCHLSGQLSLDVNQKKLGSKFPESSETCPFSTDFHQPRIYCGHLWRDHVRRWAPHGSRPHVALVDCLGGWGGLETDSQLVIPLEMKGFGGATFATVGWCHIVTGIGSSVRSTWATLVEISQPILHWKDTIKPYYLLINPPCWLVRIRFCLFESK